MSAQIQHVTYNEFLPVLLGRDIIKFVFFSLIFSQFLYFALRSYEKSYFRRYGLSLHASGFDADYDMSLEGTVANEFATTFPYIWWSLLPAGSVYTSFNNPNKLYEPNGVQNILKLVFFHSWRNIWLLENFCQVLIFRKKKISNFPSSWMSLFQRTIVDSHR